MRVEGGFSEKSAKNAYMEAEASGIPQNPIVVIPMSRPNGKDNNNGNGKPNGKGNGRVEGNAWPA